MPSKGSPRVTIRVPEEMIDDIKNAVEKRNEGGVSIQSWTVSDYIIQAVVDKLNHDLRSRKKSGSVRQAKIDDNIPREYEGVSE